MADQQHEQSEIEDIGTNESSNTHIGELISTRLSRRQVLGGGLGAGAAMVFGSLTLAGCSDSDDDDATAAGMPRTAPDLGFAAVARSSADTVVLPVGYSYSVLYALGDPLVDDVAVPAWAGDGSETAESYEQRAGDHHDAIAYFGLSASDEWSRTNSDRGLLVMNHEALTTLYLHDTGYDNNVAPRNAAQALKEINAHGVSVIEIEKNVGGEFAINRASTFNRRYTAQSPMIMSGPVAGSSFVVTRHDNAGINCRGTVNNCANGVTPWGTYLACEENWAGYFARGASDNAARTAGELTLFSRYGISQGATGRHKWSSVDEVAAGVTDQRYSRWDTSVTGATAADDYRNEHNTLGWCVEIDPFAPAATPKKRSALGRMGHEGAWFAPAVAGRPLVAYMGDDSRNEYVYKFVSAENWDPADIGGGLAAGDKYLDDGKLYVARFNANGTGDWIELSHGVNGLDSGNTLYPFTSQAAVLIATRLAADFVGATKMDRPEWGCVNPLNGEVYMTMTNNSQRTGTSAGNPPPNAANPRNYDADTGSYTTSLNGNVNGHIIRWREDDRRHDALSFVWDIYLFGSREAYPAYVNLSFLDASNDLSSPDGLWFDPRGLLWIQTDDGAYTSPLAADANATNCMMLAAVPGKVGDGAYYEVPTSTGTQPTYIGKAPGTDLRRFLVGPVDCEITGVCMTPDNKTMFVNIQHPGEGGTLPPTLSNWPGNVAGTSRPRSATIVITRNDGGEIGVA
ncbi:MAG: PhoX family protein [Pseudomonadota bacterium]